MSVILDDVNKDIAEVVRGLLNDQLGNVITDIAIGVFVEEAVGHVAYVAASLYCASKGNLELARYFLGFVGMGCQTISVVTAPERESCGCGSSSHSTGDLKT